MLVLCAGCCRRWRCVTFWSGYRLTLQRLAARQRGWAGAGPLLWLLAVLA
jgi:hypothetical protein